LSIAALLLHESNLSGYSQLRIYIFARSMRCLWRWWYVALGTVGSEPILWEELQCVVCLRSAETHHRSGQPQML